MISSLGDEVWCERDPGRLDGLELLRYSWEDFRRMLWGGRRFSALVPEAKPIDDPDPLLSPLEFLQRVAQICEAESLVVSMPAGSHLFRAREFESMPQNPLSALELGPAPVELAAPNRMSAAGVPAFYGSDRESTCLAEVKGKGEFAVVGTFETLRELRILDLTALPATPGFFATKNREMRHALRFMHQFARELCEALPEHESAHVGYLPTQVVAEFLRFLFKPGKRNIDGIWYSSSISASQRCVTLFMTRADLALSSKEEEMLSLEEKEARRSSSPSLRLLSARKST